ncbi:MAG: hypothetical protein R3F61_29470 [Myxococcota bacterium]
MAELPAIRVDRESAVRRLERRVEAREQDLEASLRRLDRAVKAQLPPAVLEREARENPYGVVTGAVIAGFVLGCLL